MSSLNLEYPREDAKTLVKLAFEDTRGIKTYHDNGIKIVGKTGAGLGSYGEKVIVEVPETQSDSEEAMISVRSEKEVGMNITANPDKYESRFLSRLNYMRGRPIDDLLDTHGDVSARSTKEVASTSQQADGQWLLYLVLVLVFIFIILMPLLMLP